MDSFPKRGFTPNSIPRWGLNRSAAQRAESRQTPVPASPGPPVPGEGDSSADQADLTVGRPGKSPPDQVPLTDTGEDATWIPLLHKDEPSTHQTER